ncbi:hypothetical protein HDU96_008265 [Phlyctochytrium bullatum]|nr:hypothetical protein HDU96_008265 [Phlyctochytrium bullatum]
MSTTTVASKSTAESSPTDIVPADATSTATSKASEKPIILRIPIPASRSRGASSDPSAIAAAAAEMPSRSKTSKLTAGKEHGATASQEADSSNGTKGVSWSAKDRNPCDAPDASGSERPLLAIPERIFKPLTWAAEDLVGEKGFQLFSIPEAMVTDVRGEGWILPMQGAEEGEATTCISSAEKDRNPSDISAGPSDAAGEQPQMTLPEGISKPLNKTAEDPTAHDSQASQLPEARGHPPKPGELSEVATSKSRAVRTTRKSMQARAIIVTPQEASLHFDQPETPAETITQPPSEEILGRGARRRTQKPAATPAKDIPASSSAKSVQPEPMTQPAIEEVLGRSSRKRKPASTPAKANTSLPAASTDLAISTVQPEPEPEQIPEETLGRGVRRRTQKLSSTPAKPTPTPSAASADPSGTPAPSEPTPEQPVAENLRRSTRRRTQEIASTPESAEVSTDQLQPKTPATKFSASKPAASVDEEMVVNDPDHVPDQSAPAESSVPAKRQSGKAKRQSGKAKSKKGNKRKSTRKPSAAAEELADASTTVEGLVENVAAESMDVETIAEKAATTSMAVENAAANIAEEVTVSLMEVETTTENVTASEIPQEKTANEPLIEVDTTIENVEKTVNEPSSSIGAAGTTENATASVVVQHTTQNTTAGLVEVEIAAYKIVAEAEVKADQIVADVMETESTTQKALAVLPYDEEAAMDAGSEVNIEAVCLAASVLATLNSTVSDVTAVSLDPENLPKVDGSPSQAYIEEPTQVHIAMPERGDGIGLALSEVPSSESEKGNEQGLGNDPRNPSPPSDIEPSRDAGSQAPAPSAAQSNPHSIPHHLLDPNPISQHPARLHSPGLHALLAAASIANELPTIPALRVPTHSPPPPPVAAAVISSPFFDLTTNASLSPATTFSASGEIRVGDGHAIGSAGANNGGSLLWGSQDQSAADEAPSVPNVEDTDMPGQAETSVEAPPVVSEAAANVEEPPPPRPPEPPTANVDQAETSVDAAPVPAEAVASVEESQPAVPEAPEEPSQPVAPPPKTPAKKRKATAPKYGRRKKSAPRGRKVIAVADATEEADEEVAPPAPTTGTAEVVGGEPVLPLPTGDAESVEPAQPAAEPDTATKEVAEKVEMEVDSAVVAHVDAVAPRPSTEAGAPSDIVPDPNAASGASAGAAEKVAEEVEMEVDSGTVVPVAPPATDVVESVPATLVPSTGASAPSDSVTDPSVASVPRPEPTAAVGDSDTAPLASTAPPVSRWTPQPSETPSVISAPTDDSAMATAAMLPAVAVPATPSTGKKRKAAGGGTGRRKKVAAKRGVEAVPAVVGGVEAVQEVATAQAEAPAVEQEKSGADVAAEPLPPAVVVEPAPVTETPAVDVVMRDTVDTPGSDDLPLARSARPPPTAQPPPVDTPRSSRRGRGRTTTTTRGRKRGNVAAIPVPSGVEVTGEDQAPPDDGIPGRVKSVDVYLAVPRPSPTVTVVSTITPPSGVPPPLAVPSATATQPRPASGKRGRPVAVTNCRTTSDGFRQEWLVEFQVLDDGGAEKTSDLAWVELEEMLTAGMSEEEAEQMIMRDLHVRTLRQPVAPPAATTKATTGARWTRNGEAVKVVWDDRFGMVEVPVGVRDVAGWLRGVHSQTLAKGVVRLYHGKRCVGGWGDLATADVRGRRKSVVMEEVWEEEVEGEVEPRETPKRRRGRPPKVRVEEHAELPDESPAVKAPRRGLRVSQKEGSSSTQPQATTDSSTQPPAPTETPKHKILYIETCVDKDGTGFYQYKTFYRDEATGRRRTKWFTFWELDKMEGAKEAMWEMHRTIATNGRVPSDDEEKEEKPDARPVRVSSETSEESQGNILLEIGDGESEEPSPPVSVIGEVVVVEDDDDGEVSPGSIATGGTASPPPVSTARGRKVVKKAALARRGKTPGRRGRPRKLAGSEDDGVLVEDVEEEEASRMEEDVVIELDGESVTEEILQRNEEEGGAGSVAVAVVVASVGEPSASMWSAVRVESDDDDDDDDGERARRPPLFL